MTWVRVGVRMMTQSISPIKADVQRGGDYETINR